MSDLRGVEKLLQDAENSVLPTEVNDNINCELHGESEDLWTTLPVALDNCRLSESVVPDTDTIVQPSAVGETAQLSKEFEQYLSDVSIEVAEGTDASYRRYMGHFDLWLQKNSYLRSGESIFNVKLPEATPLWIIAWIMTQCDIINPDGSSKPPNATVSTYTHAMKLRSALTYGFGRRPDRATQPWTLNKQNGEWEGNPSGSIQVGRYMVALRKRKHAAGDRYAMSSRALTREVIQRMYAFNQAEGRSDVQAFRPRTEKAKESWGNPRRRLLVHAVLTLAFVCLLRIDEALSLRFEDIMFHSPEKIEVTLFSRKTHPYGGSKPYHLWMLKPQDEALCPVRALARWIQACGQDNCRGYVFRAPGSNGQAPARFKDQPINSSAFLDLFRNNLLDIGIDGDLYGGQSCRRGGCQWLVRDLRWPILRVCDWGVWSKDFSHSSIIRYLFSWNDNPYEPREDFFNPNRKPNIVCHTCGRSCWCN